MKRGFTLMELIVYMALLGFVIVVAGRVFSDSTVMRVRSQSMVKTSEEVGKISHLIREDISQMGVKAWGQANSSNSNSGSSNSAYNVYNVGADYPEIYWSASSTAGAGDSSSYALKHNKISDGIFYDSIVFRKAAFDNNGRFIGIREISWAANSSTRKLVRRCTTIKNCTIAPCGSTNDPAECNGTAVVMADSVVNFNITPSEPGTVHGNDDVFPEDNFHLLSNSNSGAQELPNSQIAGNGSKTVSVLGPFAKNSSSPNRLYLAKSPSGCEPFSFKEGETYVIEFEMPYSDDASTQFVPKRDHLSIGFRNSTGAIIPNAPKDILFYPAQSQAANSLKRRMEFPMSKDINGACVAITIAYYPPNTTGTAGATDQVNAAEGTLQFSKFKIFRKADETFHFPKGLGNENYGTTNAKEKKNAKAFELILEIRNKGEKSGTFSIDENGNKKGMVITTPNNGVTPD